MFANQGKWEENHPEGRQRLAGGWTRGAEPGLVYPGSSGLQPLVSESALAWEGESAALPHGLIAFFAQRLPGRSREKTSCCLLQ